MGITKLGASPNSFGTNLIDIGFVGVLTRMALSSLLHQRLHPQLAPSLGMCGVKLVELVRLSTKIPSLEHAGQATVAS